MISSVEHSSSDSHGSSASQYNSEIFRNTNFRNSLYKALPLFPILSRNNSIHALYFFKIHFNIILKPTPRSSKLFISFMFLYQ